jgi:hypothetical protein
MGDPRSVLAEEDEGALAKSVDWRLRFDTAALEAEAPGALPVAEPKAGAAVTGAVGEADTGAVGAAT